MIIEYSDGSSERRSGSSLAWRNNNRGNIEAGSWAARHGSIGDHEGFAVFPDDATGVHAQQALLAANYSNYTIDSMVVGWRLLMGTTRLGTRPWFTCGLAHPMKPRLVISRRASLLLWSRLSGAWKVGVQERQFEPGHDS